MASDHEYREGPDAARRFERTLGRLITVSKEELARRDLAHRKARKGKYQRRKPSK